jgi:hypothetical protein
MGGGKSIRRVVLAGTSGVFATIEKCRFRGLGSAARELRDVFRGATATHRRLRDVLVTIAVATAGLTRSVRSRVSCLSVSPSRPRSRRSEALCSGPTTQLLTVSSQIKNPISFGGRILDVFMEIYAITVIAGLAGAIGSFLQKRGQEIDDKR